MNIKTSNKTTKTIILTIFIIYILTVIKLTIFRTHVYYDERQLNLSLFTDLIEIFNSGNIPFFLKMLLGNIGWFVPFGFLLPLAMKKNSIYTVILWGFLFSFFIETSQYIFHKGVAELDDLILNVLGAVVGYMMQKYIISSRY